MKEITKIVVTGGPCGGKTSAMKHIKEVFTKEGYTVLFAVCFRAAVRTADDHQILRAEIESVFTDGLHTVRNNQFLQ